MMHSKPLKIRWLADQCYEFLLPNGKHVLTDPGLTAKGKTPAAVDLLESIEGCDYVLITHSHFASTADLKYLEGKFNPFVFMGSLGSDIVFSHLDLDFSRLQPLYHGRHFELADFSFTSYVGKHGGSKHFRDRLAHMDDKTAGPEYSRASILGNVESFDFYITFPNNIRLAFVSGEDDVQDTYAIAKQFAPDILLRQYLNWPVERYAAAIGRYDASLAFAGHHDMVFPKDADRIQQFAEDTAAALKTMKADTVFVCPKPGKWYSLGMCVECA